MNLDEPSDTGSTPLRHLQDLFEDVPGRQGFCSHQAASLRSVGLWVIALFYHIPPTTSTPSSACPGPCSPTPFTLEPRGRQGHPQMGIPMLSSWGTTRKLLDSMGPGVPIAASFSRVAYNLLIDPCAWCRCGGSSRLAAGHAPTLREGGQRGLPATAASLALCGRVLSPVAVRFCRQGETYACLFSHTGLARVRTPWWWCRRHVVQVRASTPAG